MPRPSRTPERAGPYVPQYVLFTSPHRHPLDVRVFFGTQHPSRRQVTRAQAELDTLSRGS